MARDRGGCTAATLPALCPFALELAVELRFGLAQFAGEALESFFLVEAGLKSQLGDQSGSAREFLHFGPLAPGRVP